MSKSLPKTDPLDIKRRVLELDWQLVSGLSTPELRHLIDKLDAVCEAYRAAEPGKHFLFGSWLATMLCTELECRQDTLRERGIHQFPTDICAPEAIAEALPRFAWLLFESQGAVADLLYSIVEDLNLIAAVHLKNHADNLQKD